MAQLPPVPIGAPVTDESGFSSQVWSSWFQRMSSQVQGLSITSVTGAYTASFDDDVILANATGGAFSVTLPNAEERKGKVLFIKKTDASGNAVSDTRNRVSVQLTHHRQRWKQLDDYRG
jgi:hypothetical protein